MPRKLVVFDCDGVLIENSSSWRMLHEYFGSMDNKYFAELYKRGLITYLDWMKIDIALMITSWGKPIRRSDVIRALSRAILRPSAKHVVEELKKRGHIVAVVSSGVDLLVKSICKELGVDHCFYNELLFVDDELIPGGIARVPLKEKPQVVRQLAQVTMIGIENTAYIGDSEWDIEVFRTVGIPIAIQPCGSACSHAKYVIKHLEELLDIEELS